VNARKIGGLYAITADHDAKIVENVEQAVSGGATIVQYRDKSSTSRQKLLISHKLKEICKGKALFIINDDVDLALAVDADGVHLGEDDEALEVVRNRLGPKIIGVSCYNKLQNAITAEKLGADYVAFGRFFTSDTKPAAIQADLDLIKYAKQKLTIPVVGIGGITLENAGELIDKGVDAVATVNGLFRTSDIKSTAQKFNKLFK